MLNFWRIQVLASIATAFLSLTNSPALGEDFGKSEAKATEPKSALSQQSSKNDTHSQQRAMGRNYLADANSAAPADSKSSAPADPKSSAPADSKSADPKSATATDPKPASSAAAPSFAKNYNDGLKALQEGKFAAGEKLLKDTLKMEASQGNSDANRTQVCLVLADLYRAQKRHPEAEAMYKQVIARAEIAKNEAELAAVMSKLASLYKTKEQYEDALELYRKTLALVKKNKPESADEATVHANIALLYQRMNKPKEVEAEEQLAIKMFQSKLGTDSPEAAQCMTDLASFYMREHKAAKATPLLESAIGIFEKKAPDKLATAICAEQLGTTYFAEGKYAEAETLSRKALAIYQKLFGNSNMQVAITYSNLGYRLSRQGKNQDALDAFNKSLAIQEKLDGQNPMDMIANIHGMAEIFVSQAEYKKAENLLRRELSIREKTLGPKNPSLVAALRNLGNCLILQGAQQGAYEDLLTRADGIAAQIPEEKRKSIEAAISQDMISGLDLNKGKGKGKKKEKGDIW